MLRVLKNGFSLLELSVVLVVIALMMAGMLNLATQKTNESNEAELVMKLDAIETALMNFRKANNRLPCPADGTLATTNTYYGVEGTDSGDCTTGSTYNANVRTAAAATPTANFYNSTYSNTVGGVVPTRSLGLPESYMFDPWGGRITYTVDKRATEVDAFTTYGPLNTTIGSITVKTLASGGTTLTSNAVILLLSHGKNGHGAFQLSGTRKTVGSSNTDERKNCHCTSSSMTSTAYDSTFVQHTSTETTGSGGFDDTVRYYTRSNFITDTE